MREFGIRFIFQAKDQNVVPNHVLTDLRREIAHVLQLCEFGDIVELPDNHFVNTWATPAIDVYDPIDNELYISFHWAYPLEHGSLYLLYTQYLESLYTFSNNLNMPLVFKTQYN